MHRYKTLTTKRYIDGVKNNHWRRFDGKLWQRNYWEHIIRNENEYQCIAQYIIDNPQKWAMDKLNGGTGNQVMEPQSQYSVGVGPRACPNDRQPQSGQPQGVAPTGLGDIVHRYKTLTTKRYIDGVKNNHWRRFNGKLWQRNYWEHIIRNENEYQCIAQYIIDNPQKWAMDKLNGVQAIRSWNRNRNIP